MACAALAMLQTGCNRRVEAGPRINAERVEKIREVLASGAKAGGGDQGPAPQTATGWATIRGTFKVVGTAPTPAKLNADKDTDTCGKHPLFDESVVVADDGGLANALIYLRTKVTPNPDLASAAATEVVLDNKDCRFEPHVLAMRAGQTLVVKNSDPVGHNSNIDAKANPSINALIPSDNSTTQVMSKEESQPVKVGCNIHPWMGAWLVVRNDPYASVSDKSGGFVIEKLPSGIDLEFQLWQEKPGPLKNVQVEGAKIDGKGRLKLKLEPDQQLTLNFDVPVEALAK
jgi:plastocyanin